jgi:hypothetical protein
MYIGIRLKIGMPIPAEIVTESEGCGEFLWISNLLFSPVFA